MMRKEEAKQIYVPVLTKRRLIVEYDHNHEYTTFKQCKKECNSRNADNYYSSKGTVWMVAKYGRPKLAEEFEV